MRNLRQKNHKVEIGFPILNKKIATNSYPSQLLACSLYTDNYDNIIEFYAVLHNWINTNGYKAYLPTREIRYNYNLDDKLENQLTLIMIPIKKQ